MKKKISKVVAGVLVGSMVLSTNVFANQVSINQSLLETQTDEATTRMAVGKYVEIIRRYPTSGAVPNMYYYSYYDHDYNTTLHGHLTVMTITPVSKGVDVIFSGYVCGTI